MTRQLSKEQCVPATKVTTSKDRSTGAGDVTIGTVVDVDLSGIPWIDYPGNPKPTALKALTTTPVSKDSIGRQAALLFSDGNLESPVIIGLIKNILDQASTGELPGVEGSGKEILKKGIELDVAHIRENKVVIDGERMVFAAEQEIVLKCGKASITLTRAGKILIRGTYLSNRSSGVNRIKGGSVQIN